MNLGEIREDVYDFLQEDPQRNHSLAREVERDIHIGHMKLWGAVGKMQERYFFASSTLNEAADNPDIALPTNLARLLVVQRIAGNGASTTAPQWMRRTRLSGDDLSGGIDAVTVRSGSSPSNYILLGNSKLRLIPTPSGSATASIQIFYVFRPAKMQSDEDEPLQPAAQEAATGSDTLTEFHDIIGLYALERALIKEESQQLGAIKQLRAERLQDLSQFIVDTDSAEPRFVPIPTAEYME